METEYINQRVFEILNTLKCAPRLLMSWGANNFRATIYHNMAALKFNVNGFIHKGDVIIAYNASDDLYEVYCLNYKQEIVNQNHQIYFDTLSSTIDRMIEKNCSQELYNKQVDEWLEKEFNND